MYLSPDLAVWIASLEQIDLEDLGESILLIEILIARPKECKEKVELTHLAHPPSKSSIEGKAPHKRHAGKP